MGSAFLVQVREERLLRTRTGVAVDFTALARRRDKLDGREPADAVLARDRARTRIVRVEVRDFAAVVAVERGGDLGPDGLKGLAVAAPRRKEGDEGALGLARDDAVGETGSIWVMPS